MNTVFEVISALGATSSRLEKEAILKQDFNENLLYDIKRAIFLALDPRHDFYIKKYKRSKTHQGTLTLEYAMHSLDSLMGGKVRGKAATALLERLDAMLSEEDSEVMYRIIQRDLKCGVSEATVNKIWPGFIYVHPYQRCSSFNEKNLSNIKLPAYSQTKEDGLYVDVVCGDKIQYMSRSGRYLDINQVERDNEFKSGKGFVFQGECLALDESGQIMDRSKGNGYLNSDNIDPDRVVIVLWDMLPIDDWNNRVSKVKYINRFNQLKSFIDSTRSDRIKLIDTRVVKSVDEIINHFKENVNNGLEGTVIKNFDADWQDGTSKDQVKCKIEFTCELRVIGAKEGTNKNQGKLGALLCTSEDKIIEVSVGGGYSDKLREDLWKNQPINEIIEVKANDITQNDSGYSLFLPRYVKTRKDKSTADTYDKILELRDSFVFALKSIKV